METICRSPVRYIFTKQQREWKKENKCPMCGLPKNLWKRRKDWTCCSKECTDKYQKDVVHIWQYWKLKVFERDKYTCVKCGFQSLKEDKYSDNWGNFEEFKSWEEQRSLFKEWKGTTAILFRTEALIADHIVPIAIGGEEYDLSNVQTLCIDCNKIKTKKDMKEIALYRKKNKSQEELKLTIKKK
jgi:hypothetical protein